MPSTLVGLGNLNSVCTQWQCCQLEGCMLHCIVIVQHSVQSLPPVSDSGWRL